MENTAFKAIAIVGVGAVLPDAPNAPAFWENVKRGRDSITEVTPDRWDQALYYNPDHSAPDKTYSKIGGWVRNHLWEPVKWRLAIPPRVIDAMDEGQKWAISCAREALQDYGYPERPLNLDRTAVVLGNAMGGEKHYLTSLRVYFPEYARELDESPTFSALPEAMRRDITRELNQRIDKLLPAVTEDSMPGELANCIAGRVANVFNLHGPNYTVDAACASAMAAINSAVEGLIENDYDVAIAGGVDHNMGAPIFVKFCKIGALSATGSRPYAEGADGFVMGEGAAVFLLKRLADAERDGDKIYAVLRGMGASSDGKGKGITAPNPVGQKFAIERAWQNAGLSPGSATLIEGHGTSTAVGDVVEAQSMAGVLAGSHLAPGSVALGSVKSNIGHLKAAAGAAAFLKSAFALRDKVLPPSLNFRAPNPNIDFVHSPLYVNTELKPWNATADGVRRAGLSAFGFGGTNFHAVLEEYIPHRLNGNGKHSVTVTVDSKNSGAGLQPSGAGFESSGASPRPAAASQAGPDATLKAPLRGALVIGADSEAALADRLRSLQGQTPVPAAPAEADLRAPERLVIDYGDAAELADRSAKALKALAANQPAIWKALRAQGIFRGRGPAPRVAFLYTGQGSQYVNMLKPLRAAEPLVAETFAEADRIMTPLLGKPLSEFIFIDADDPNAVAKLEDDLRQTAICQPAVLATDLAMTRLLGAYGIRPDMTMGHSLGEYGALVAAGGIPFDEALEAVSARGGEMSRVSTEDNGRMAAIFAPLAEIERTLKTINGYVVIANINSNTQAVIGGASRAVEQAMEVFLKAGFNAVPLPVSHAFHTAIVAPASVPLRRTLERMHLQPPVLPIVANVDGKFYPAGSDAVPKMLDILGRQVAAPVQFVKGLRTLYEAGARVFVEVGPKKALQGFAEEVLGDRGDVVSLFTNHPKVGDIVSFNQALCGLYAAGLGAGVAHGVAHEVPAPTLAVAKSRDSSPAMAGAIAPQDRYTALGRMFADVIDRASQIYQPQNGHPVIQPVAITGAALGLPGTEHIFDDGNIARILGGEQLIDVIPTRYRRAILDKHITRLVKTDNGGPTFESIANEADVIKLAGRGGAFDLVREFGIGGDRIAALDRYTQLAIAVGIDALRDAGIPLVLRYKTTTKGTQLQNGWALPEGMRDDTGVIFASAFPGLDSFADETARYYGDRSRREQLSLLETLRPQTDGNPRLASELDRRIGELRLAIEKEPYIFDRRFIFRILSMGHSQFAELIGARGPNTQVNAACASTTQAVGVAEDWIRTGRCRRVVIVAADDITSDHMLEWMGSAFLATGAAATDGIVEEAALPFDRRRHGMIIGMGAAAFVLESPEAIRERGVRPICEVLSAVAANSAFHGTRLDIDHICQVMEKLVAQGEARCGISRSEIARQMVFVSHETYTPARGGSASAEIHALRRVFGDAAANIVIANTKGFTGHAMGAGIEDVVAVKALETGWVPPVANFKEADPELGQLNLSKGGIYPIQYALRLGAGFGSQISMTLLRLTPSPDGVRPGPHSLGYAYRIVDQNAWSDWLQRMSGYAAPDLEVVNRTLRVRDQGAGAKIPETARSVRPAPAPPPYVPLAPVVAVARAPVAAPPPAKAPAVPVAPAAAPQPAVKSDPVKERILALVSQKTGYPVDMLALDLDLEADLGVDTVKQAEVFAGVREAYGIERDDTIKLRDFPTLAHVIQFVYDRRPDLSLSAAPVAQAAVAPAPAATPPSAAAPTRATTPAVAAVDAVKERILALVAQKTGYPVDMLDLDLDLEADLGVDTVKQAEVFAGVREAYGIERDDSIKLRDFPTLAHVIQFVYDRRPDLAVAPAPVAQAAAAPAPVATPLPAVAPAPVTTPAVAAVDAVKERILALVAQKTGYPIDMLDLDLDLEADLGVDTVKQAEVFAGVRETYGIERDDTIKLRDFPTLAHVIQFVYDRRPDLAVAQAVVPPTAVVAAATPVATPVAAADTAADPVKERILALVVEKTGYPLEMLDLDLDLEADLGVDTVKQAELFASVRGVYDIPRDSDLKLREFPTLAHVIKFVYDRRPDLTAAPAPTPVATVAVPMATAPATVAAAAEAPVSSTAADDVQQKVLEIVAEKTGYPQDMLDLELDLEADLGVDTVKQAEVFASVRAAFDIPRDGELKLRDFPTLAHVIRFARDRRSQVTPTPASGTAATSPATAPAPAVPVLASLDAANGIPRRVPVPILRPALNLCKPTPVALGAGSRIVVMPDEGGVAIALAVRLQTLNVEVLTLDPSQNAEAQTERLKQFVTAGPVQGVYWLPALDNEGSLMAMDLAGWREALRVRAKSLFITMRALFDQVAQPGTFLVSATRMGGQHGYNQAGAVSPLGGAVSGFTKTYKRERVDALVKAIDFETETEAPALAQTLLDETLRDPGAVEIGYQGGLRWTVGLEEQPAADGLPGLALDKNTVFVVTGAAGGIVSAITADLAAASGGTFYLLDLVPEPDPNNPDLKRFPTDRDGLKRDLFARIQARGERATPALVEKELAALERAQAAVTAISAVQAAGGTAHYFSVNLTDGERVTAIVNQIREGSGRIDVLLHAAGLERSHFLPDKDPREFDLVFDVKSDGWFNLLRAIGDMPLGATVAFSSIAGRFGNGGQADYSSANDLLCKITSSFRTIRPGTRGIVIDWTAWGGIGMATRGSIPKMMELAGIDMLPPEAGVPLVRRELTAGGTRGEVVIAQRLGILTKEWDETGGLDTAAIQAAVAGPMAGKINGMRLFGGLEVATTLDPKMQPFLYDHQIDGTPVLPGVMGTEAFAEAALSLLPGWNIDAIEDMNFLAPFKFYRNEPRTVTVQATFHPDGESIVADCKLTGERQLPNQAEPQVTTHFVARVRLTLRRPETGPTTAPPGAPDEASVGAGDIYKVYFHGPAYQVMSQAWEDGNQVVGLMAENLPVNHQPSRLPTLMAPRLIELCFQTAGVWEISTRNRMGLPLHFDRVRIYRSPDQAEGRRLYAVVTPQANDGSFDAEVVDTAGNRYVQLSGYRTVALPNPVEGKPLRALRAVLA